MNLIIEIVAGAIGTFFFTLFSHLFYFMMGYNYTLPSTLGRLVFNKDEKQDEVRNAERRKKLGCILHYLIGIIASVIYFKIWPFLIHDIDIIKILLFGLVHGVIALGVWYFLIRLRSADFILNVPKFLLVIFLGHLVFAFFVFASYFFLADLFSVPPSGTWYIFQNLKT